MLSIDYTFIKNFLSTKRNIVITTHKTPDGDALGSSLALYNELKKDHNVNVIVPNEYPYCLKWLPGNNEVLIYEGGEEKCNSIIANADLLFFLDFNKLYRTYTMSDSLSAVKVCVDIFLFGWIAISSLTNIPLTPYFSLTQVLFLNLGFFNEVIN